MTRIELIRALETLLTQHAMAFPAAEPAPELGNKLEYTLTVIRRLCSGQCVCVSPRVIREIVRELKL